jgi:1-acyl-sn-glycerol-3-phosphate acyltransferase
LMLYIFFSNIVVVGRKNIPKTGPVILTCNHVRPYYWILGV